MGTREEKNTIFDKLENRILKELQRFENLEEPLTLSDCDVISALLALWLKQHRVKQNNKRC